MKVDGLHACTHARTRTHVRSQFGSRHQLVSWCQGVRAVTLVGAAMSMINSLLSLASMSNPSTATASADAGSSVDSGHVADGGVADEVVVVAVAGPDHGRNCGICHELLPQASFVAENLACKQCINSRSKFYSLMRANADLKALYKRSATIDKRRLVKAFRTHIDGGSPASAFDWKEVAIQLEMAWPPADVRGAALLGPVVAVAAAPCHAAADPPADGNVRIDSGGGGCYDFSNKRKGGDGSDPHTNVVHELCMVVDIDGMDHLEFRIPCRLTKRRPGL